MKDPQRYHQWCSETHHHALSEHEHGYWIRYGDYVDALHEIQREVHSLKLALDAERFTHAKDNAHLLDRAERAEQAVRLAKPSREGQNCPVCTVGMLHLICSRCHVKYAAPERCSRFEAGLGQDYCIRCGEVAAMHRDACKICKGTRGGYLGNEQIVGGILMCDYCHADHIRR